MVLDRLGWRSCFLLVLIWTGSGCGRFGFAGPDADVDPDGSLEVDADIREGIDAGAFDADLGDATHDAGLPLDSTIAADARGDAADVGTALDAGPSCVAEPESCDGLDNDCDGATDEVCPCTPTLVTIAPGGNNTYSPRAAWNGSGYGVTVRETPSSNSDVYFISLDRFGAPMSAPRRVTTEAHAQYTGDLVWTGSEYGAAIVSTEWDTDPRFAEIAFIRLTPAGAITGSETRLTSAVGRVFTPALHWTGSEYVFIWPDGRHGSGDDSYELYLTRAGAGGAEIGDDVRLTNAPGLSWFPETVLHDGEIGACWIDSRHGLHEVYFARYGLDGTRIGAEVRVTNFTFEANACAIASTGDGYSLIAVEHATDTDTNHYDFHRLSPTGAPIASHRWMDHDHATSDPHVAFLWNGAVIGIAWRTDGAVRFQRLTKDGARLGTEIVLASGMQPEVGRLMWNDLEFSMILSQFLGTTEPRFVRVACP